jgi:hypothetical protein
MPAMTRYYGISRPTGAAELRSTFGPCMPDIPPEQESAPADSGLRRMFLWVAVAFVVTVLVAMLVVELMLRWFGAR